MSIGAKLTRGLTLVARALGFTPISSDAAYGATSPPVSPGAQVFEAAVFEAGVFE